jgi:DNA-binding XRE family transcriptional regulator
MDMTVSGQSRLAIGGTAQYSLEKRGPVSVRQYCGKKRMSANNLRLILVKEGIKQTELAQAAGVAAGTVNKVCGRWREVSPTMQSRLVVALNRRVSADKYRVEDVFPEAREGENRE